VSTHGVLMVLLSATAWLGDVPSMATPWARSLLFKMSLVLLYAVPAIALWPAPIQGWLLLISGWARRAAFSCAVRRAPRSQHPVLEVLRSELRVS
jgi:hypothetical protein